MWKRMPTCALDMAPHSYLLLCSLSHTHILPKLARGWEESMAVVSPVASVGFGLDSESGRLFVKYSNFIFFPATPTTDEEHLPLNSRLAFLLKLQKGKCAEWLLGLIPVSDIYLLLAELHHITLQDFLSN